MKGRIIYNLTGLSAGNHSLTVKAWDNFNNSSEKSISFQVLSGGKFTLKNLFNYPNPFSNETRITLEHNRPDNELNVLINIFNIDGRIIKIIKTNVLSSGYNLPPLIWDGKDDGGKKVGRGIYLYVVFVTDRNGETARSSGRMIIL
jgi:flagellar hook assembly protein FlgD